MGTILLYYKYVAIDYPHQIRDWQKELCSSLGLTGRIILAREGINGTVGGTNEQTTAYIEAMKDHPLFADMEYKTSSGSADDFHKLSVKVKEEIVNLGIDPETLTPTTGGKHLTPREVHELLSKKPDDLVLLDTRNGLESQVGTFTGSILPNTKTFRQFPEYIDQNINQFKDKKVLMFCTGGVRCERASAYLKQKGIDEVYQIKGGIHCYTQEYPEGFFRGKNYVFDERITVKINDDILGRCGICSAPNDTFINCINVECNKHFVCCPDCKDTYGNTCGKNCQTLIMSGKARIRPDFQQKHLTT